MTDWRRWVGRVVLAGFAFAAADGAFSLLQDDPDPLRLALVVLLLVSTGALLLDSSQAPSAAWAVHPLPTVGLGRADPRTAAYLRLIEGHLTAADADHNLRDRLRLLTDQVLRVRHDLTWDDPRAEAVIGQPLLGILTGPPRRLGPSEIEHSVRRIEEL